MLFSDRSVWTMVHGIVLGGGALLALSAALFALGTRRADGPGPGAGHDPSRALVRLLMFIAGLLWLTVLVGTYVSFPAYRATPPPGTLDLTAYPRSLINSNPDTVWLHAFAMEIKEHMPWVAAMLATAVAFVARRHRSELLRDSPVRGMTLTLTAINFLLVAFVSLLGVFINKVAPLE